MLGLLFQMVRQWISGQRLARVPELEPVMRGDDRCRRFAEAAERENTLAVYDYCLDLVAGSGLARGRVLDLGCGSGQFLFNLGERLPGLELTGIDASPEMVALCRERAALQRYPERFSFLEGDMIDLTEVPDQTFDLTTWIYAAHHTKSLLEVRRTLSEMARVTRKDGGLLLLDLGRLKTRALNEWYVRWAGRDYPPELLEEFRASMQAAYTTAELEAVVASLDLPGLRHFATAGLPVLQVLFRPPRMKRREVVPEGLIAARPDRSPEIERGYRQVSLLMRLGGLEPTRLQQASWVG